MGAKRLIDRDAPPHRCPTCNRLCRAPRDGNRGGTKPHVRRELLRILRQDTPDHPVVSVNEIAAGLDVTAATVRTYIWRLRMEGTRIYYDRKHNGYHLGGPR